MRVSTLASAVLAAASLAYAEPKTANIYIQPFDSSSLPFPLAEVTYDISAPDAASASVTSYDAPALPDSVSLVRVGIYDTKANKWSGSVSLASVENLGMGYAPFFLLSVDATKSGGEGEVLGASLRGVKLDGKETEESGPQAKVYMVGRGKQPELNKPIVLSPEGKTVEKEEKTFLQKYVVTPIHFLSRLRIVSAMQTPYADFYLKVLVDDRYCNTTCHGRRWRRWQIELGDGSMRLQQHSKTPLRANRTRVTRNVAWHDRLRELTAYRQLRCLFPGRTPFISLLPTASALFLLFHSLILSPWTLYHSCLTMRQDLITVRHGTFTCEAVLIDPCLELNRASPANQR